MNQYSHFADDEADLIRKDIQADPANWRLIRRLQTPDRYNDPQGGTIKRALVIDVETTGLSTENDDVIQLAMLPFEYEAESGRILTVHKSLAFDRLREPGMPIPEDISIIIGITDDMVSGKNIDESDLSTIVANTDLIVAHNASFDRPMVERLWHCFSEKPWACTLSSVDWLREGYGSGKLDYLGMQFGWFYDGHRAMSDCEACLALLAQTLPKSGRRVMSAVRDTALRDDHLIRAVDAPIDLKDSLRQRGYRWRPAELPNGKVWWTVVTDPDAELSWLRSEIYGREASIPVRPIAALERYSDRIWNFDE